MAFSAKQRRLRLKNEYGDMVKFQQQCPWVTWEVVSGSPPYVTEYKLKLEVKSVISSGFDFRNNHEIRLKLPSTFPESSPEIVMVTRPAPYHPNWWRDGRWCEGAGSWDSEIDLVDHVVRMVRTLEFDTEVSNPESYTDGDAEKAKWFCKMRDSGRLPVARTPKPNLTGKVEQETFEIFNISSASGKQETGPDDFNII
tara:strand:- start:1061 stop:1654 length:594 start_codon:yes stop_codon:yes gene_type:complete